MQQIVIDLTPSGIKAVCYASQYDIGRSIRFALVNNKQVYTLAGTETITLKIRKPDGTERTENIANTSSTYVDLVTSRDTCDQSGDYECELRIVNGDVDIGTGNFIMQVEADAFDGIIEIKTASGAIASFETSLPFPLNEAKFTMPYRAEGYTELTHFNSKTAPVHDFAPYHTRINNNIGNLALEKLVGVSCVFNQLVQNSNAVASYTKFDLTMTRLTDIFGWKIVGTYNYVSGDRNAYIYSGNPNISIIENHIYCMTKTNSKIGVYAYGVSFTGQQRLDNDCKGWIIKANASGNLNLSLNFGANIENGTVFNDDIKINIFDLTAMFGSTVADYIYTLENS